MSDQLAIEGGSPVRVEPFPAWPSFDDREIEAVVSVLESGRVNYWSRDRQGLRADAGLRFEQAFADFLGVPPVADGEVPRVLAVANGTVALELALVALEIGDGDDVIVPARTFFATASSVVARGARPVVADVDRKTQNVTADTIRDALTPETRAAIVVHLGGLPCDMDPIMELARERGLVVIEDCAQALGATYDGKQVGSLGDAGAFSFCQDKIMTTGGEGGMLVLSDEPARKRAWAYRDHGKDFDDVCAAHAQPPGFKWLVRRFGTNWRLTEMQSAIGLVDLPRVPQWVEQRRANAALLRDGLAGVDGLQVAAEPDRCRHVYYRFYFLIEPARLGRGWTNVRIADAIAAEGVPCQVGSCPDVSRERAFDDVEGSGPELPVAEELGETALALLVHHTAGEQEMRDAVEAVRKVMSVAASA